MLLHMGKDGALTFVSSLPFAAHHPLTQLAFDTVAIADLVIVNPVNTVIHSRCRQSRQHPPHCTETTSSSDQSQQQHGSANNSPNPSAPVNHTKSTSSSAALIYQLPNPPCTGSTTWALLPLSHMPHMGMVPSFACPLSTATIGQTCRLRKVWICSGGALMS